MSKPLKASNPAEPAPAPIIHLQTAFLAAIRSLLILQPKIPAAILAERVAAESDPAMVADLGRILALDFLTRQIRAERAKESKREQFVLPGFEHIPPRIKTSDGKPLPIEKATYTDLRDYSNYLGARHRDRKRADPKLSEVKALMERMRKHLKRRPGVTVGELFGKANDGTAPKR